MINRYLLPGPARGVEVLHGHGPTVPGLSERLSRTRGVTRPALVAESLCSVDKWVPTLQQKAGTGDLSRCRSRCTGLPKKADVG
jgi:hypothetical protein